MKRFYNRVRTFFKKSILWKALYETQKRGSVKCPEPVPPRPCMLGSRNVFRARIWSKNLHATSKKLCLHCSLHKHNILKLVWYFFCKISSKKEQFIVDLLHEQFFKCILFQKAKDNCKIIHFSLKHVFWSNIDKCLVIVAQNKRELTFYNSLAWLIRPISYQEPVISMLYFFSGKNCTIFFYSYEQACTRNLSTVQPNNIQARKLKMWD